MCNCFDKIGNIELHQDKRYRVWIGKVEQVTDGQVRTLGIGAMVNDEHGKMVVTKFTYCPSCGTRWEN